MSHHMLRTTNSSFLSLRLLHLKNIDMPWVHQGIDEWITLISFTKWIPVWAHISMLVVLLLLSGLFSGLNLGLMAIDRTELKIIMNAGTEKEKRFAKKIRPLRENGNYLLCSLLLGNVLVNATLTILLDDLTSGLIAVIGSTVGIVIFGEIVPQAVCSRHGLAVGAKTVWITKMFMGITFPLSYPISVILDKALGEELGNVYDRARLKELILVTQGTNDLEKDEVNIISGALELKQKTAAHVMTKLEDVYMLPIDAILDFDTVSEIMSNGYSRIPVYEKSRGNVISLLYARDLAFVDADDKMPLRSICEFYDNQCHFVFENTTLDVLFKTFKKGNKGHMAFVHRVKTNDKSDPVYEVIGLVTMEDVIEELIQEEINDETDIGGPEHKKRSRGRYNSIAEAAVSRFKTDGVTVSPQLTFAAFQYLSTAVTEFGDARISKSVLERLLRQSVYYHIKIKNKDTMKTDANTVLFERGKPADYFIMILEGKVFAEIGKENLIFESGPFSYFGTKSLNIIGGAGDATLTPEYRKSSPDTSLQGVTAVYIPDYNVRAVTDLTYVKISRAMYIAAKQATVFEKSYSTSELELNGDKIDEELQKHLRDEVKGGPEKAMETALAMTTTPMDICEAKFTGTTGRAECSRNCVEAAKPSSSSAGGVGSE
ncbi:Metal transporter CNNM4 [Orchesella cincta]|uniref:Metal transporter CNNM4 n=1 Tax=Orchesella cincta TaxID=48709 RepID=A0A1D2NLL8_ORCCI|nr:Metal transporter CNNM4 [Orchesella cincta]